MHRLHFALEGSRHFYFETKRSITVTLVFERIVSWRSATKNAVHIAIVLAHHPAHFFFLFALLENTVLFYPQTMRFLFSALVAITAAAVAAVASLFSFLSSRNRAQSTHTTEINIIMEHSFSFLIITSTNEDSRAGNNHDVLGFGYLWSTMCLLVGWCEVTACTQASSYGARTAPSIPCAGTCVLQHIRIAPSVAFGAFTERARAPTPRKGNVHSLSPFAYLIFNSIHVPNTYFFL